MLISEADRFPNRLVSRVWISVLHCPLLNFKMRLKALFCLRKILRRFMRACWDAQDRDTQPDWDKGYWHRMGFHLSFLQQFETKAPRLFIANEDLPWRTEIGVLPKTPERAKTLGLDSIYQHIIYSTVSLRWQKFSHFSLPLQEYYTQYEPNQHFTLGWISVWSALNGHLKGEEWRPWDEQKGD